MMDSKTKEKCGTRIAEALKLRGMRPVDLCARSGVPKTSLSFYLKCAYEPRQDRICAMAKALNVSEAWLSGYNTPMERESEGCSSEPKLTSDEKIMLSLFRQFPENEQKDIIQVLKTSSKAKKQ